MKIAILGCSGSGKSTLANILSEQLGIPHFELDQFFHLPNWNQPTQTEFKEKVSQKILDNELSGWIIDGNYQSKLGSLVTDAADVIIWFNLSRYLVTYRVVKRTLYRTIFRKKLWNSNKENFQNMFKLNPHLNIILWTWTQHSRYKDWGERSRGIYSKNKIWLEIKKPADIKQVISTLVSF